MRGNHWVCSLLAAAVIMAPSGLYAQQCAYPHDSKLADNYIYIDGSLYEYIDVATSKKRLAKVLEVGPLQNKVAELELKVGLLENRDQIRLDTIALFQDSWHSDQKLIDELVVETTKPTPLFKTPVVNFAAGVILVGGLFVFWNATNKWPQD